MPKTVTRVEKIATDHQAPDTGYKKLAAMIDEARSEHTQRVQVISCERNTSGYGGVFTESVTAVVLFEDLIPDQVSKSEYEQASGPSLPIVWLTAESIGAPNSQRARVMHVESGRRDNPRQPKPSIFEVLLLGQDRKIRVTSNDIVAIECSVPGMSHSFRLATAGSREERRIAFDALMASMPATEAEWAAAEWRQKLQTFRAEWLA